jgi:hypothetical protein
MPTLMTLIRFLALLVFARLSFAQDTKPPLHSFSLTLSTPQTAVKTGSPITLTISMANTSDHDVAIAPPDRRL